MEKIRNDESETVQGQAGAGPRDGQPGLGHRSAANIIALSDGTGNSSAAVWRTNVWKLYRALDLKDPPKAEEPRQFALYDDGVGSASFKPLALLGGMFGFGLSRNVRDLYAFICRTYREGDQIYLFGFSRGAFTVRILAGLIGSQGVVPYTGDEAKLQRDVSAAYRAYRRAKFSTRIGTEGPIRAARDAILTLLDRMLGREPATTRGPDADIAFIGVWDTVAAYGLPVAELTRAIDDWIWPLDMPDRYLGRHVKRAVHALALDEERNTFFPRAWNEGPRAKTDDAEGRVAYPLRDRIEDEKVSQVWFAGVHSDVGGGYPDDSFSYVPLLWIMEEARARDGKPGLRYEPDIVRDYEKLSDENGPLHNSRQGLAGYWRYMPRRMSLILDVEGGRSGEGESAAPKTDRSLRRWLRGVVRGDEPLGEMRQPKIHESVFSRIRLGADGYAPITIAPNFRVALKKKDGVQAIVFGVAYLAGMPGFDPKAYRVLQEHVFDLVWRRRVVFFLTLLLTYALVLMPLYRPALGDGACASGWCFVSPILTPLKAFLPGFADWWLDSFSSHPGTFLLILIPVLTGLAYGGALEGAIRDHMRAIWYAVGTTRPKETSGSAATPMPMKEPEPSWTRRGVVQRLRTASPYRTFFRLMRRLVLPIAFVLLILIAAFFGSVKTLYTVASSWGGVCTATPPDRADAPKGLPTIGNEPHHLTFRTSEPCRSASRKVEQGATYRLTYAVPSDEPWLDDTIPAGSRGVASRDVTPIMSLATVIRRHWAEPWFAPMARVGADGNDIYALKPKPSIARDGLPPLEKSERCGCDCEPYGELVRRFSSEITARTTGELFLYVNDAIGLGVFYDNNHGAACVTIEKLAAKPACSTETAGAAPATADCRTRER